MSFLEIIIYYLDSWSCINTFISLLLYLPIQRGGSQLPEFGALVCQTLVERWGVEVTDGFEHGGAVVLGIELREGGNLAGEQEVEVLLGWFRVSLFLLF